MVFNLDSIQTRDTLSLLESLPYIEREYVDPTPSSIPLMELEDHPDVHFVRYSDLEHLAEVRDMTIHEAAESIQKANLLPARRFVVAMEEWRPLINPSIINEFPNVILIKEQGPLSIPYRLCETYLGSYIDTKEPLYLNLYLEAIENESFAKWLLTEAWDGYKGDLESMKATRAKFYAARNQASAIANNTSLPMEQRQKATADMNAIDRSIMTFDDAIAAREKLQADRKASQQGAIALERKRGKDADHPNAPLTPEQQKAKVNELKAKQYDKMQNKPGQTQPQQTQQPEQQQQQGWWARNWSAFKNWMNNLGSSGDQKSTWFTNLTNKVKSFFNGGAQASKQQQQAQQNTTNQPTSSGSGATSTGNQAANQQQQQAQQNTTNQPTSSGSGGTSNSSTGNQAANQQQQQAQQNTTNQPTSSGSGDSRNLGVDVITNMAGQQVMNKSSQLVDGLVGKTNDFLKDKFGLDLSPLTAMVGEFGKAYVNQKISQGMDHVKDTGGNLVNTGMNQVGNAVKQGYQNAKAAITGGS